ncbi:MAG: response regulator [Azospirillum sp.]|nr:response regulator [Azospirillum sp.]
MSPSVEVFRREERRLHGLIVLISWAIACVIALGVPVLYFVHERGDYANRLESQLELAARAMTALVSTAPDLWQFQTHRIEYVLDDVFYGVLVGNPRVYDRDGTLVYSGTAKLDGPFLLEGSRPFLQAFKPVGRIAASIDFAPMLFDTVVIAGVGSAIAFGVFLLLRWYGLRVLGNALNELEAARDQLQRRINELEPAERHLSAAIAGMSEGFVLFGPDDGLILCNQRFKELYEPVADLLIPGVCHDLIMRESARRGVYGVIDTDPETWVERRLADHRGKRSEPILSEMWNGRVLKTVEYPTHDGGIVAIHSDVSNEFWREAELRTAKEEAEAAARAKSEFLATVSHEIRTPLNGVIGMAELLMDTPLSDEQRHYARIIDRSADALLTVVNDLLDFSKLESGRMSLDLSQFCLAHLIEEAVGAITPMAAAKGLKIGCCVAPELTGTVVGDAKRIRQIVMNYASNAVKFTDRGGLTISASVLDGVPGVAAIKLSIKDTGIGIADANIPRLFTMFYQVDSSLTRRFGGAGLGLAICHHLVTLMGGDVGVVSELDKGSHFWAVLPLQWAIGSYPEDDRCPPDPLADRRILVVDDLALTRDALEQELHWWGAETAAAADGSRTLDVLRAAREAGRPFDLMVIDDAFPEIGAGELMAQVRAPPEGFDLPIALLATAAGSAPDSVGSTARADIVLTKPVLPSVLHEALVGLLLHPSRSSRETADQQPTPRRPLRILVADPPKSDGSSPELILRRLGHQVDLAVNGREVVAAVRNRTYDMVFIGLDLPLMDGSAAVAAIRSMGATFQNLPIVGLTAGSGSAEGEQCFSAGMSDHLPSSSESSQYAAIIKRWLRRPVIA